MAINWTVSKHEAALIIEIVGRAEKLAKRHGQPIPRGLGMDLTACHANGTPLDLARLVAAPDADFAHDVWGIHRHISRETGRLGDFFLPRCAAREKAVRDA